MKRIFIALIAGLGVAWIVAGAQAQQYPLPTRVRRRATASPPPPPPPPTWQLRQAGAKMSIAEATFDRFKRTTSILAPISTLASGVGSQLLGGGRITEFNVRDRLARAASSAPRAASTRPRRARRRRSSRSLPGRRRHAPADPAPAGGLRAARLSSKRPTISPAGQLDVAGAITRRAKGVVRVSARMGQRRRRVDHLSSGWRRSGPRALGRALAASPGLPRPDRQPLQHRAGQRPVHGLRALNMRGEMRAFQVMPKPPQP